MICHTGYSTVVFWRRPSHQGGCSYGRYTHL